MEEDEIRISDELDANNKNRSFKNILSKKSVSKYELDEIFADDF